MEAASYWECNTQHSFAVQGGIHRANVPARSMQRSTEPISMASSSPRSTAARTTPSTAIGSGQSTSDVDSSTPWLLDSSLGRIRLNSDAGIPDEPKRIPLE